MARITFIENRGKTSFWTHVARALMEHGHLVSWIVQNHVHCPPASAGVQVVLPYPEAHDHEDFDTPDTVPTDRGRIYFNAGATHYAHYMRHIEQALDRLCPDVVIGEPTLFHELLTIAACRKRAIPYLHPTMSRYPNGRFNILTADSQIPAISSGESWSAVQVAEMAETISDGRSLPSYMKPPNLVEKRIRQLGRIGNLVRTTQGRMSGERYNTPSVRHKWALDKALNAHLKTWRSCARIPESNNSIVLYPLQMQPEANIDVWGRPYSDQIAFVLSLLDALPPEGCVAVKANPKSKYEVSAALVELAQSNPRIVLLPLKMKMGAAQALCTGAVTVSGTVGFEAVFGRGRCLSLCHPVLEQHFPQFHASSPMDAVRRLLDDPAAGCGDAITGAAFLAQLVHDSFPGTINEPLYDPSCISKENIAKVTDALSMAISTKTRGHQP